MKYTKLSKENGRSTAFSTLLSLSVPVGGYAQALYYAMRILCTDHEGDLKQDDETPCSDDYLCRLVGLRPDVPDELEIGRRAVAEVLKAKLFKKIRANGVTCYRLVRFNEMCGSYSDTYDAERMRRERSKAKASGFRGDIGEHEPNKMFAGCSGDVPPSTPSSNKDESKELPIVPLNGTGRREGGEEGALDAMATAFYEAYPKKAHYDQAAAWFEAHSPDQRTFEAIMLALGRDKRSPNWAAEGGRFIPLADNWLAKERWTDNDLRVADNIIMGRILSEKEKERHPDESEPTVPVEIAKPKRI